jgi:DNA (cytosine-5)-methyltransferase 1
VQSFPDWFRFPASRTHAFRLIGNAVPPLVAEAVGLAVKEFLAARASSPAAATEGNQSLDSTGCHRSFGAAANGPSVFGSRPAAAGELLRLANLDRRALRALSTDEFLRGWHALLFLFPELHPDNALDHGDKQETWPEAELLLPGLEQARRKRYARSGWPVALELIGREAWCRYEQHKISEEEFYCVEAQRAGLQQKVAAAS